jgi:hypothetical protein
MTLVAECISASILSRLEARPGRGRVHSVFERTVNILGDHMAWFSLHPAGTPMHPYAVRVAVADGPFRHRSDGCGDSGPPAGGDRTGGKSGCRPVGFLQTIAGSALLPGDPVSLSGSSIGFERQAVTITLEPATVWDPSLPPLPERGGIDLVLLIDTLRPLIGAGPVTSPFLAEISGTPVASTDTWSRALSAEAAVIVRCIVAGLRTSCPRPALDGIRRAVGLGPGFTPSGDDYLAGLLAAYRYFSPCDRLRQMFESAVIPLMGRTPLPSCFMLKGALGGLFPEPLVGLLRALGEMPFGGDLARALGRLRASGASSGEDMLAGVLTYLEARAVTDFEYATN